MKENFKGTLVTVLSLPERPVKLKKSSYWKQPLLEYERGDLQKDFGKGNCCIKTPYGTIRFKQGVMDGRVIRQFPEYENVKDPARKHEVPFYEVYSAALTSL